MDNKILLFLGMMLLSFIFLGAAIASPAQFVPSPVKLILLLLSLLFDILAFASRYYSHLMIAIIRQRRRSVVLSSESAYRLSETGEALIAKNGDQYAATMYMSIPLYTSATEMSPEEKLDFGKQIGRLISINNDPVRYSVQMRVMNKDFYIESIHDMITNTENEVVKLQGDQSKQSEIERLKGGIEMWNNILNSAGSTQSLELMSYASLSATGATELEAFTLAQQKARDLMSGISATLGVMPLIVVGQELSRMIEPEHALPFTTVSEQITKKIEEEVI